MKIGLLFKATAEFGGHDFRFGLLDTARAHAVMSRFDHYRASLWLQSTVQGLQHVFSQGLLCRQAARENVDQTCNPGDAGHMFVRAIRDMGDA